MLVGAIVGPLDVGDVSRLSLGEAQICPLDGGSLVFQQEVVVVPSEGLEVCPSGEEFLILLWKEVPVYLGESE